LPKNGNKPEAQIKAVAELVQITIWLRKLFELLPSTTKLGIDAFPLPLELSSVAAGNSSSGNSSSSSGNSLSSSSLYPSRQLYYPAHVELSNEESLRPKK
jgi:hypothetical protein